MLQKGDQVPHFHASRLSGEPFHYSDIWQQRTLVLVSLPAATSEATTYAAGLYARQRDFGALNTDVLTTSDRFPWMPSPGVLVADKWGEVVHVAAATDVSGLASPDEILDWASYVQARCPECEGESR